MSRSRPIVRSTLAGLGAAGVFLLAAAQPQQAPQTQQPRSAEITLNFRDTDITQIAEAVAAVTNKNFIIDPRVRARRTAPHFDSNEFGASPGGGAGGGCGWA